MRRLPLLLPAAAFAGSYTYLAAFHGSFRLFSRVVHEDGLHTFAQTMFFFPHFLGHVPVLATLALVFAGAQTSLSPAHERSAVPARAALAAGLGAALGVSLAVSLYWFGATETWRNILQQQQSAVRMGEGGSWALHLPSTMMLLLGIPLYVAAFRALMGRPVTPNRSGAPLLAAGAAAALAMTCLVCGDPIAEAMRVWSDPRYLAHSVRELATFPVTVFPPALALLWIAEGSADRRAVDKQWTTWFAAGAAVFGLLLVYQVLVPLRCGIGNLAQKPAFAPGGHLPVAYLLSFHYFEHFLDMLFFAPLCLLLSKLRDKRPEPLEAGRVDSGVLADRVRDVAGRV